MLLVRLRRRRLRSDVVVAGSRPIAHRWPPIVYFSTSVALLALMVTGVAIASRAVAREDHYGLLVVRGTTFSNSAIFNVCVNGRGIKKVAPGMWGDWSPTSRRLVVERVTRTGRTLTSALFLVSETGRAARRLSSSQLAEYWPAWSWDGRRVILTRESQPNRGYLFYTAGRLWSIDYRTRLGRPLSHGLPPGSVAFLPAARPDGRVAFSVIAPPIQHRASKPGADIYLLDQDGAIRPLLTDRASESVGPAAWSPDGRKLAFFRRGQGIFVLDVRTMQVVRLTNEPGDSFPGWSPDGRRIAFTRGADVYVMRSSGADVELVIRNALTTGRWWERSGC
jgi:dipeptidyl aminopeptidase/acylaminoacyl peptidase